MERPVQKSVIAIIAKIFKEKYNKIVLYVLPRKTEIKIFNKDAKCVLVKKLNAKKNIANATMQVCHAQMPVNVLIAIIE